MQSTETIDQDGRLESEAGVAGGIASPHPHRYVGWDVALTPLWRAARDEDLEDEDKDDDFDDDDLDEDDELDDADDDDGRRGRRPRRG